jgi:hypothetical protein
MTNKEDLPGDDQGGYVVIPRRIAVLALVPIIGFFGMMYVQVQQQGEQIALMRADLNKIESWRSETDRARSDMRAEAAVLREKMSAMESLLRETRDLVRELGRDRRP